MSTGNMAFARSQRANIPLIWKASPGCDSSSFGPALTPAIQQGAALSAVHRRPSSLSSCFRRSFSTHFCGATHLGCDSPVLCRCRRESGGWLRYVLPTLLRDGNVRHSSRRSPCFTPACWLRRCRDHGDKIAVTVGRDSWSRCTSV